MRFYQLGFFICLLSLLGVGHLRKQYQEAHKLPLAPLKCDVKVVKGSAYILLDLYGNPMGRSSEVDVNVVVNRPVAFVLKNSFSEFHSTELYTPKEENAQGYKGTFNAEGTHKMNFLITDIGTKESAQCSAKVVVEGIYDKKIPAYGMN